MYSRFDDAKPAHVATRRAALRQIAPPKAQIPCASQSVAKPIAPARLRTTGRRSLPSASTHCCAVVSAAQTTCDSRSAAPSGTHSRRCHPKSVQTANSKNPVQKQMPDNSPPPAPTAPSAHHAARCDPASVRAATACPQNQKNTRPRAVPIVPRSVTIPASIPARACR